MQIKLIIYFLTNYFLLTSGFIFLSPLLFKSKEDYEKAKKYFFKARSRILFGILGMGIFSLALFFPYTTIIIIGDLIPVTAVFFSSIIYLISYIKMSKYLDEKKLEKAETTLLSLQVPVGGINIALAVIHILIPHILFL